MIPDSALSDAETDNDAPSESDDSDLYEGGEDGAVEQKQDTEDEPWKFGELPKQHPIHFTSASGPQTPLNLWLWDNQNESERSLRCGQNEERRGV